MKKRMFLTLALLAISIIFTIVVFTVDVAPVGLLGTEVGFSSVNTAFSDAIGFNESFYFVSDILGYVALLYVAFFAAIGLCQAIKRKSILEVNPEILLLGAFYIVIGLIYIVFSKLPLNYRPVFIDGVMEPSFPSSHTILALTVCISSVLVLDLLFSSKKYKNYQIPVSIVNALTVVLAILIITFRTVSGAHWLTDIIAAVLYSGTLLMAFYTGLRALNYRPKPKFIPRRSKNASSIHNHKK